MAEYDSLELGKYYSEKYLKESGHVNNSRAVGTIYDLVLSLEKAANDEGVKNWTVDGSDNSYVYKVVPHGNGAQDVVIQDVFNRSGDISMLYELNAVTLSSSATIGGYFLSFVSGHNFVAEDHITLSENGIYFQAIVIGVAGDVIEINVPLPYPYSVAAAAARTSAKIEEVDGSATRVVFKVGPPKGSKWDVYGMSISFRGVTDMDDAKFVGITALTRGCFVAKYSGYYETRFSFRSNSDMKQLGTVEYSDKAPSGEYGLTFAKSLKDVNGVAIRLDGDKEEILALVISDDLTDLTHGRAVAHGHIVEEAF